MYKYQRNIIEVLQIQKQRLDHCIEYISETDDKDEIRYRIEKIKDQFDGLMVDILNNLDEM